MYGSEPGGGRPGRRPVVGIGYWKSRENLWARIIVHALHALIDAFPAMTLIKSG